MPCDEEPDETRACFSFFHQVWFFILHGCLVMATLEIGGAMHPQRGKGKVSTP
jgi:hypothetical protein